MSPAGRRSPAADASRACSTATSSTPSTSRSGRATAVEDLVGHPFFAYPQSARVSPWSEPRSFDALLDVPGDLRPAVEPYLVRFTYLLHDLSEISDDELREGAMRTALAKLVAMCFKHADTRGFLQILGRWMDVAGEVVQAPRGLEALAQVMRYRRGIIANGGPASMVATSSAVK